MTFWKKIANAEHEEEAAATTRHFSRHGLSKRARRVKRIRNRAAKRAEARIVLKEMASADV